MSQCRKVVLYNPTAVFWTMPLGLIAVGSALDPAQYEVKIVDARLEKNPLASLLTEAKGALCVGMGVLTGEPIRDALGMARALKKAHPNIPVVWGGWHPSLFPAECLEENSVDVVVSGQGEVTFAELVERYSQGGDLHDIAGLTWRDSEGQIVQNQPRPTVDVNLLPPHNYNMIRVEDYFEKKGQRQMDYISSIGCRFRCAFCADPFVYNRSWYGLQAERMASELSALWDKHRFEEVSFQDETFFTRRERVEQICNEFLERSLKFEWTGTMRADQGDRLPEETLALCKRAGLRRVMVGVEAGTDEMLKRIKKDITIAQVFTTAEKLVRHDIGAIWNFIVGFPSEPQDSFEATLQIAKKLRAMSPDFEAALFFYKPYPGNELADALRGTDYRFPSSLEEWADFDYVGSAGPWVSDDKYVQVDRFKFYQKYAFGRHTHPLARPLQRLARWRLDRDMYRFPVEKAIVERLRPAPRLS